MPPPAAVFCFLEGDRPYQDRGIHGAVRADPYERPAIGAARLIFELFDDLHCPDFGRARDRPTRECGLYDVESIPPWRERRLNRGDEMVDIGIGLQRLELRDADAAGC